MRCSASDGEAEDERPFETGTSERSGTKVKREGESGMITRRLKKQAGEAASYSLSLSVAVSVSELIAGQAS